MKPNVHRWLYRCFLFVVIYMVAAVAAIECVPSSDMRFWNIRVLIFRSLGWCCLVHLGIVLTFLVMRKWLKSVLALGLLLLLFAAILIEGLTIGPDIDTVRRITAEVTGIQAPNLVCVGGRLSRESIVVFKVNGNTLLNKVYEEVPPESNTRQILIKELDLQNVHPSWSSQTKVLKFSMEFNTVFAMSSGDEWWIVFFGNAVM